METAVRPPESDGRPHPGAPSFGRRLNIGLSASLAVVFALAILISQWPLAFGDTYHVLAAQMVAAGRKPYVDFFLQQTPLYPLICGAWMRIFGSSWHAANLLSALLICGSAAITALIARRAYSESQWGTKGAIVAVLLFGLNLQVAHAGDDAQPYALCMFFCLLAWLAALHTNPTPARTFLTGLAAGAAVNTSLLAAPLFLIVTGWSVFQADGLDRVRRLLVLGSGSAVASIPLAYLAILAPTQAWFDIVEFQLFHRTVGIWQTENISSHNLHEILNWMGSIQGAVMVGLCLAGSLSLFASKARGSTQHSFRYATSIAVLWALCLTLLRPTFRIYYILVVPYVSLLASAGLCGLAARVKSPRWSSRVIAGTMALYALGLAIPLVASVLSRRPSSWAHSEEVARILNAQIGRNEPVYADDESIYVAARRLPPRGLENSFGATVRLPAARDYARAGLVPPERNEAQLRAGKFAAVVLTKPDDDARIEAIKSAGLYSRSAETERYVIFWKPEVERIP